MALTPPLDPLGFLGMVPVEDWRWTPAEIGGELAFIYIAEFFPKQTLSLGLGVTSPAIDPPEVVSSLASGKTGPRSGPVVL